jgi:hypothetical protein
MKRIQPQFSAEDWEIGLLTRFDLLMRVHSVRQIVLLMRLNIG